MSNQTTAPFAFAFPVMLPNFELSGVRCTISCWLRWLYGRPQVELGFLLNNTVFPSNILLLLFTSHSPGFSGSYFVSVSYFLVYANILCVFGIEHASRHLGFWPPFVLHACLTLGDLVLLVVYVRTMLIFLSLGQTHKSRSLPIHCVVSSAMQSVALYQLAMTNYWTQLFLYQMFWSMNQRPVMNGILCIDNTTQELCDGSTTEMKLLWSLKDSSSQETSLDSLTQALGTRQSICSWWNWRRRFNWYRWRAVQPTETESWFRNGRDFWHRFCSFLSGFNRVHVDLIKPNQVGLTIFDENLSNMALMTHNLFIIWSSTFGRVGQHLGLWYCFGNGLWDLSVSILAHHRWFVSCTRCNHSCLFVWPPMFDGYATKPTA